LWFLSWCRWEIVPVYKEATKPLFPIVKFKLSLRNFYGRHNYLVNHYRISLSQMTMYMFCLSFPNSFLSNTTDATCEGTAYPSKAPDFISIFWG
jgi:hypothetical protein